MLATITGAGDGTAPVVNITFPFLDKSHVIAAVDGTPVTATWTGTSQVTFASPVPAGSAWSVYRKTPTNPPVVDFTDGSVLTEADLDKAETSHRYRDEELADLNSGLNSSVSNEITNRQTAVANEATARASADNTLQANIDAEASARSSADASEATARQSADNAEAAARAALESRSLRLPSGETLSEIPARSSRSGKVLAFSSNGDVSLTALASYAFPAGGTALIADSRAALAAYTGMVDGQSAVLGEAHREGIFKWSSANHSTDVTSDPQQGVYIAPTADLTGATGAWVRQVTDRVLTPYMFGATGGFQTEAEAHAGPDDHTALQAAFTFWKTRTDYSIDLLGLYWGTSSQVVIQRPRNGTDQHSSGVIHSGNIVATNGSTGTDLVVVNWPYGKIQGRLGAFGTGTTAIAGRGWLNGIRIVDSAGLHVPDGLELWQFKRWGAYTDTLKMDGTSGGNNIALNVGKIHGGSCGSAANPSAAASTKLTYTFDSVVYNGSAGLPTQTMTVHIVEALDPNLKVQDPFIYDAPSGDREVFTISAIDFVANTLTFHYWFPGAVTSGTLTSAHGGLMMIEGGNTAYTNIGQVTGMYLGSGLDDRGMYGAQVQYVGVEVAGIEYARGNNPTDVSYGGMLLQRHAESTYIDLFIKSTSNKRGLFIGPADVSGSGMSGSRRDLLGQTYQSSPRNADDTFAYRLDGVVFNDEFGLITPDAGFANVSTGLTSFTISNRPHERNWRKVYNSAPAVTVTLDWYDDYSRLFVGKNWMRFELFGTSSRGGVDSVTVQLTAALVSAGWTLNGGTAALSFPKVRGPVVGRVVVDPLRKAFKFVLDPIEPAALFGTTVNGDVAATLTVGSSTKVQIWNTPLTATRAVTLSTAGVSDGDAFEIIRTSAATGASSLNIGVGPLKALAAGQKAKVTYSSALAAWVLTGFETL